MATSKTVITVECRLCHLTVRLWPPMAGRTELGSVYVPARCPRCGLTEATNEKRDKATVWTSTKREPECEFDFGVTA